MARRLGSQKQGLALPSIITPVARRLSSRITATLVSRQLGSQTTGAWRLGSRIQQQFLQQLGGSAAQVHELSPHRLGNLVVKFSGRMAQ